MSIMREYRNFIRETMQNAEEAAEYLKVSLEKYGKDGNSEALFTALRTVVEAQGGTTRSVKKSSMNRPHSPREAEQWKELSILFEDVIHELNQPVGIIGSTTKTLSNYLHTGNVEKAKASLKKLSVAVEDIGHRISVYKGLTQCSGEEETIRVRDLIVDVECVVVSTIIDHQILAVAECLKHSKFDVTFISSDQDLLATAAHLDVPWLDSKNPDRTIPFAWTSCV